MAEGVVSFVVQYLTDLLNQEVSLIHNVRDQVQQLRDELKFNRSFLRDADNKQETDERVREWVSAIRDITYDAEDIIDNYILHTGKNKGLMKKIITKGVKLHNIGKDIEAIQKRLSDISSEKERYGIKNLGEVGEGSNSLSETLRMSRRSSPYGDEEDITGLNDTVKELVTQLTGDELRRCVISIVGMGGLGKTSLAKKIYNHSSIKSRFQDRAWVYVSQEYSIADLLRRIIKSFTNPSKEEWEMMETEEDLERCLYNFLERKQYLVVLDDVWDSKAWQSLKRAFPNKNNGSRVLLTTRKLEVALSVDDQRNPPHQLRFLTKEESWELFCKKVFPNNCGDLTFCSPAFEELGRKMVEKCDGLPLGIIVLGGLLSKKQPPSLNEWKRVLDHISTKLMQDETDQISQILSLSYNDLPYQLKSCFLHMGLYPEDSSIYTEKLIQLWVAEGFIPQGEELMEDVAKDYLNELIDRSMIQAEEKNWSGVLTCRVHDLLRDLSISKAKEEGFLDIFEKVDDSSLRETSRRRLRRLTIHFDHINRFVSLNDFPIPYLRSIICFNIGYATIQLKQFRFISTNFKLLKILDLDADINDFDDESSSLPDSIGEMIHLRYLGLEGMRLNALPASIENLQRLHTLKMGHIRAVKLPNVLWKLKQLRHLQGNCVGQRIRHLKIDTLINLQTLDCIRDDVLIENEDLANLTNLRTLSIRVVSASSNVDTLSAPLSRLSSLQHLTLTPQKLQNLTPIVLKSLKCYNLLYLELEGEFEGLPNNLHQFSPNLTEVSLVRCKLKEDPMAILEQLPNLLELNLLLNSYVGKEIICSRKGFPRLQVLKMTELNNLSEWRVEEGAMPSLQTLRIDFCPKLDKVPEGFKFLTSLNKLEFVSMPSVFQNRVLQGGEDTYKVQHIPSVTFRY